MKIEKIEALVDKACRALAHLSGDPQFSGRVLSAIEVLHNQIIKRDERIKNMREEWLEDRRVADNKLHEEVRARIEAMRMWEEENDKAIISKSNKEWFEKKCNDLEKEVADLKQENLKQKDFIEYINQDEE